MRTRPVTPDGERIRAGLGPISSLESYPLEVFKVRAGMTRSGIREARMRGLVIRRAGKRCFINGADWIKYLETKPHGGA